MFDAIELKRERFFFIYFYIWTRSARNIKFDLLKSPESTFFSLSSFNIIEFHQLMSIPRSFSTILSLSLSLSRFEHYENNIKSLSVCLSNATKKYIVLIVNSLFLCMSIAHTHTNSHTESNRTKLFLFRFIVHWSDTHCFKANRVVVVVL